jgi:tRNA U34 5-methylaminomethyl-2-thiouridine-forming methyltransferase MnmC
MEKKIILTEDGSHTIAIPERNLTYHSIHGAIHESVHVFIKAGLEYGLEAYDWPEPVQLFEMGLGTGLNAILTAIAAEKIKRKIIYTAIEPFPLADEEIKALNYQQILANEELFLQLHRSRWQEDVKLTDYFSMRKERVDLLTFSTNQRFHLIYYDAFAPSAQPELWTGEVFEKLYHLLRSNSLLVTYCAKGDVRRAMQAAGFTVEKLKGPPGKREMLRATKS